MDRSNRLTICKDNFCSTEEFEECIKDTILVLLKNRYIAVIDYEEPGLGIVSIDYSYSDRSYGDTYPYFLTPEEVDRLISGEE